MTQKWKNGDFNFQIQDYNGLLNYQIVNLSYWIREFNDSIIGFYVTLCYTILPVL